MTGNELPSGLYTDRYELAMALAYWRSGRAEEPAVFDYFFRRAPFGGGYAVFAGLGTLVEALERFRFGDAELAFLLENGFPRGFLNDLRGFAFRGSLWAPPEGEVVFAGVPVLTVAGGLLETQIIETLVLNVLNFQTLVATKASRCRRAAGKRVLSEFGLRRAQGTGGLWASRAACIGGCDNTSNLAAAREYGLKASGTMAHSFIQSYDSELEAFRDFARVHGPSTVLLLDTYDTLRSGLPNAIAVAREMEARGERLKGVRLDSGDLAYLSRKVRAALDVAGLHRVVILASNQVDEHVIRSLKEQSARIDGFGIGTSLATGAPDGALDGVYKLAETDGVPRLKASETVAKTTLPGRKTVYRMENGDGMAMADVVCLAGEPAPDRMVHPFEPRMRLGLTKWRARPLRGEVMSDGRPTRPVPSAAEAAERACGSLSRIPAEHLRFENPHTYKVGVSVQLRDLRDTLLAVKRKEIES